MGAQGDLFSACGFFIGPPRPAAPALQACETLDDRSLLAALDGARRARTVAICAEIATRRVSGAVPALEALCRRFLGYGVERAVPEQIAALGALEALGGSAAADALARIIAQGVVQGPGLRQAMRVATALGFALPNDAVLRLLRHDEPEIRAAACRFAGSAASPEIVAALAALLDELHAEVREAAAIALGRVGRFEARAPLLALLDRKPSAEIIEALAPIADEDCVILLGRVARKNRELRLTVLAALDAIDHPRAETLATALRCAEAGLAP
ncbi:MAG: HEAT repeat domain-containing protein [Stellaceae bacterium]